jgi:hypothetical protein
MEFSIDSVPANAEALMELSAADKAQLRRMRELELIRWPRSLRKVLNRSRPPWAAWRWAPRPICLRLAFRDIAVALWHGREVSRKAYRNALYAFFATRSKPWELRVEGKRRFVIFCCAERSFAT